MLIRHSKSLDTVSLRVKSMFDYTRLLCNAMKAYENAKSDWAQEYWLEVAAKLAQNIDKN
jgi:hypothetical protein